MTQKNTEDKTAIVYSTDLLDAGRARAAKIVTKVTELQANPKGNAYIQLKEWKKIGDDIIKYFYAYGTVLEKYSTSYKDLETGTSRNNNKRWTADEDEKLIELVCAGEWSPIEISTTFGRSIPAIKTRVSKLVGLKRLSAEIAGQFIGTIDGEKVEGRIDGKVYKE